MLSVPHLDRDFDYLVAAEQSDDAQPGVRARVRFHGRFGGRLRAGTAFGHRPRRQAGLAGPGGLGRAGADTVRCAGWSTRSPPGTPAPAPTCCGWRCRRGTPPPNGRRSPSRRHRPPGRRGGAHLRVGGLPARRAVPRRAVRRPRRPGGLAGAARRAVGRPAGRGGGGDRARRAQRAADRARPARRRHAGAGGHPAVRRATRGGAVGGPRARAAVPALAGRAARHGAAGHRHPQRGVRAGRRPRP